MSGLRYASTAKGKRNINQIYILNINEDDRTSLPGEAALWKCGCDFL